MPETPVNNNVYVGSITSDRYTLYSTVNMNNSYVGGDVTLLQTPVNNAVYLWWQCLISDTG